MVSSKKQARKTAADQKKLANLIHKWAYMDAQKNPKKFDDLFKKIWDFRHTQER